MNQEGRTVRCPMCGRRATWRENPFRPFCSERCRLADLDGWLSGRYVVASAPDDLGAAASEADVAEEPSTPEWREKT